MRPHLAWLVSGWLAGVCLLSLRPLIGWHGTWRLRRVGLSEVPDSVSATLLRLAERLGLRRAVVRSSNEFDDSFRLRPNKHVRRCWRGSSCSARWSWRWEAGSLL
ncbi:MAG: hypothetical protein ACKV2Q_13475 [Planctomycetaceae bacterium]